VVCLEVSDTVAVSMSMCLCMLSVQSLSPEASQYETCYVTAHKGACRCAAFHPNGSTLIQSVFIICHGNIGNVVCVTSRTHLTCHTSFSNYLQFFKSITGQNRK